MSTDESVISKFSENLYKSGRVSGAVIAILSGAIISSVGIAVFLFWPRFVELYVSAGVTPVEYLRTGLTGDTDNIPETTIRSWGYLILWWLVGLPICWAIGKTVYEVIHQ